MPDLPSVTTFINSPPGQLAAGAVLAGIVWKFFERVEAVLTEATKFEIAVWLVGVRFGEKVEPWLETFAKVFDRVFGTKHISWKCFLRSSIASLLVGGAAWLVTAHLLYADPILRRSNPNLNRPFAILASIYSFGLNIIPDYISLLATRTLLGLAKRIQASLVILLILVADIGITVGIASVPLIGVADYFCDPFETYIAMTVDHAAAMRFELTDLPPNGVQDYENIEHATGDVRRRLLKAFRFRYCERIFMLGTVVPAVWTSVWLWLYAGSGFLLKFAHRFDLGFDWFNRKFDIEKHPLNAIGLVGGAVVALIYWGVALGSWFFHHA